MRLEEELMELDFLKSDSNNVIIEEAKYKKVSKEICLSLVLDRAICLNCYKALVAKIKDLLKPIKIKQLLIGYKDDVLDEANYLEYLDEILEELSQNNALFKAYEAKDAKIDGRNILFLVPKDDLTIDGLADPIKDKFADYGLDINVSFKRDENKSYESQIAELDNQIEETLAAQRKEAQQASNFNAQIKQVKKNYRAASPGEKSSISNIPSTETELDKYKNESGEPVFMINAYVYGIEFKDFKNTKSILASIKVTDDTDSIVVKKWLRGEKEIELFKADIKPGIDLKIIGRAEYDSYAKEIIITARDIEIIGKHIVETVTDDEPIKRVELHAHTKMSTLDGLADGPEYLKLVDSWGWKAMGFTDRSGVYVIPEVEHVMKKFPNIKPIFGVELPFIDDDAFFITYNEHEGFDASLRDATFVVFDIETTGLSQSYDTFIEIGAHKVYKGGIIDQFETFINPLRHIPEKITELTSITDDDVKDAPTIEEALAKFLEFSKGAILVAHNAKFDVGMTYMEAKKHNIPIEEFPVIDTLNLFRALSPDEKKFDLKNLCKYYKVKQEHHHRASDDTRVTALCFLSMLNDLAMMDVRMYSDINKIIKKEVHYKNEIAFSIDILAKNLVGFKNMYKILSDALTTHLSGDARCLKSVVEKYREGILVGSGTYLGKVFEYAYLRSEEELEQEIKYFDYVEVLPPSGYAHLYDSLPEGKKNIEEIILKIINAAKKLGKTVVAVSNSHYLRPIDKKYRSILINSPQIGGGVHRLARYAVEPDAHLRTTKEMLDEFSFLDKDLAYEIVVTNTNLIADQIERFETFKPDMFAPADDEFKGAPLFVPSIEREVERIVKENTLKMYGENPHPIIKARIDRELNSIISNGYASVYYVSHLMVKNSLENGYIVGSRGSVGSSVVATMMNITEVNALAPHYRCPNCKFHAIRLSEAEKEQYGMTDNEKALMPYLEAVDDGFDLEDKLCPVCGKPLKKDGHDIPFETFLGFDGDKVPDIDLNFSGDYQARAHEFIRSIFGYEYAFRGGTVGTIADKNAYGYVKGYCERKGKNFRSCEMDRIATHLVGIKRSTGQHPGGIVVVPHRIDIFDVTPIQYPADDPTNAFRTTHYDYHSFENNLLKLDVLGHDDPTIIKYLMDYVHEHQEDFPFTTPQEIPVDDKELYKLFNETEVIGLKPEDLGSQVASFAVPEFGTNFVRQMLLETKPKTFAQLVKISGLSHGTNVWATNAQELVSEKSPFGVIPFKDIIGCRDDIMVDLINKYHLEPLKAFKIMEFVRKGKLHKGNKDDIAKWNDGFKKDLEACKVDPWYIWSCERIEYMFPKAHAIAYVMMALRIAWFKVYSPALFYSAWFSKRAKAYNVQAFLGGPIAIAAKIEEVKNKPDQTAKDDDMITSLQVAYEMTKRGIKFLPVDIKKSSATVFEVEDGNIRLPFVAVDKLGESVALGIVQAREEHEFTSKADVLKRTKLNSSLFDEFNIMHVFGDLPDEDKEKEVGLFAFEF